MKVRFDSLNRFEVPKFYVCNPGCTYNNGILSSTLGALSDTTDEELVLNFNTTSELNFRLNKIRREDPEENRYINKLYHAIQNRRLIFVEDVGFFVIRDVTDGFETNLHYKDVRAESCEFEISQKTLPYIKDGTYQFRDLLEKVVASLPLWKIGDVNLDVSEKWRTFEDVSVDTNALSFLLDDMQNAYECIFLMDTVNRLINVYDQNYFVEQTNIHITKDDLIDSIEINENSDDLYTAISVQGDENLNISPVNPLGGNVIYNFSYYLDWMSPGLSEKVDAWQKLVLSKESVYYNLNLQYYELFTNKSKSTADIDMLKVQLDMYRRMKDNIVAEGSTVTVESYNKIIVKNGGVPVGVQNELRDTLIVIDGLINKVVGEIAAVEETLRNTNSRIDDLADQINSIREEVSILRYFTDAEYSELSNYIFEGNYTDEYIAVTENMTYTERFQQMKTLYDRSVARLMRISEPTQEFSIDVENFLFIKEFAEWSEQLKTGCLINVELETGNIASLFLSNITVNYDDKELSMTFGNRFNRFDPKAMFNDVLGNIKRSANSINYIKEVLYPVKNGEFGLLREAIESSGILTKNAALTSTNQEILIDDTGILGRKLLKNGEYDDKQIKITNQSIVFTEDGWETASTALGNFLYNNPFTGLVEEKYGVVADTLIGNLVLSEEVGIYNNDNSITLDENGLTITSDCTGFVPKANVFTIQKRVDVNGKEEYEKQLYIDSDGNVVINGTISIFTDGSNYSDTSLGGYINSTDNRLDDIDGEIVTANKKLSQVSDDVYNEGGYVANEIDKVSKEVKASVNAILYGDDGSGGMNKIIADLQKDVEGLDEYYLIIRYSPYSEGRDLTGTAVITEAPDINTVYMGICYNSTSEAPEDPDKYDWTKIKGDQGIQGKQGVDGKSQYLHIKYADIVEGDNRNFTTDENGKITGERIGKYIGVLVDNEEEDSMVFDDYVWKLWTEDVSAALAVLENALRSSDENLSIAIDKLSDKVGNDKAELDKIIDELRDNLFGEQGKFNGIENTISKNYQELIGQIASVQNWNAELGQYIAYGTSGLILGAKTSDGESPFRTTIDNRGVYFSHSDENVAWITGSQLFIESAVIEQKFKLGNFFFSPRPGGSVSLTWQDDV